MPLRSQLRPEIHDKFVYYTQLHLPPEKTIEFLVKAGASEEEIFLVYNYFKVEQAKAKHSRGIILTIIGSLLLVAGFIITAVLYHNNSPFEEVMYGFTGLGLALLIWGVKDLF